MTLTNAPRTSPGEIRVEAGVRPSIFDPREFWQRRHLIFMLALRDFRVRYRQAVVGVAWAVLQPLAFLAVLYPIFSQMSPSEPGATPTWLKLYAGLVLWQMFSGIVNTSSVSLQQNHDLVSKVNFPRVFLPLSSLFVYMVDLCCGLCVLMPAVIWTVGLRLEAAAAVIFIVWTLVLAGGIGIGLSALNAMYRDVSSILPFMLQLFFFGSGVFFDIQALPERWTRILSFNPLATTIIGFRWALLGSEPPSATDLLISAGVTATVCFLGLAYFSRIERRLADYL